MRFPALSLLASSTLLAQSVVVPNANATTLGTAQLNSIIRNAANPRSYQYGINASQLAGVPIGSVITGVSVRFMVFASNPASWPPADITWKCGVDVLSFGATKNGALVGEAVVFFDPALARDFELRRKRSAHLFSKMRYLSAQLLCCLTEAFFLENAARANRLAVRIGAAAGNRLLYPVQANAVFLRLRDGEKQALRARGFGFYDWGPPRTDSARFVVSWDQPEADVDALCEVLSGWN
jgi:threonine aldolase